MAGTIRSISRPGWWTRTERSFPISEWILSVMMQPALMKRPTDTSRLASPGAGMPAGEDER